MLWVHDQQTHHIHKLKPGVVLRGFELCLQCPAFFASQVAQKSWGPCMGECGANPPVWLSKWAQKYRVSPSCPVVATPFKAASASTDNATYMYTMCMLSTTLNKTRRVCFQVCQVRRHYKTKFQYQNNHYHTFKGRNSWTKVKFSLCSEILHW